MPIQLIVNADDFGYSSDVNAAVAQAHRFGTLTSASLMVTAGAANEAVSIAKDNPGLSVGLHLALSRAKSALPPEVIPALVGQDSRFSDSPVTAGFRYFFSSRARKQLSSEIEAQFEAFRETGLPLSHVDGHQHLHAHPVVMPIVIGLARRYGACGIRVPKEPLMMGLSVDASHPFTKIMDAFAHAWLSSVARKALAGTALASCRLCIGGLMSGRMTDTYCVETLKRLDEGPVEIYFHPSTASSDEPMGPNPGDLRALMSPVLKDFIDRRCRPVSYRTLKLAAEEGAR